MPTILHDKGPALTAIVHTEVREDDGGRPQIMTAEIYVYTKDADVDNQYSCVILTSMSTDGTVERLRIPYAAWVEIDGLVKNKAARQRGQA